MGVLPLVLLQLGLSRWRLRGHNRQPSAGSARDFILDGLDRLRGG
jgi:hypothetical protein